MANYDVVIVGSGHAGANLAYLLAKSGKKVLIIEAGPQDPTTRQDYMENFYLNGFKSPSSPFPPDDNAQDPAHTNVPRPTLQDLVNDDPNDPKGTWHDAEKSYFVYSKESLPFGSSYERVAGGTGLHWMGTCLRMLPNDFKLRSLYGHGRDWPLSYEDLRDNYGEAEGLIGVSADVAEQEKIGTTFSPGYSYPMPGIPLSVSDQFFAAALQCDSSGLTDDTKSMTTLVTATPAGRNSRPYQNRRVCHGNTNCTPICPIQAKYDPTVTLSLAQDTGNVDIIYKSVVDYVTVAENGLVTSVHYLTYEDTSVPAASGKTGEGTATATTYVLAAHAVENAKILLNSASHNGGRPIANTSDQLGRNLMDHPVFLAWGMLPEGKRAYNYRGPLSTAGIESLREGPFRSTRAAWRIELGNEGWNWSANDPYTTALDFIYGTNLSQLNPAKKPSVGNVAYINTLNDLLTRQIRFAFLVEQEADPGNRVQLSGDYKDNLGIPRPLLTYNLSDYTKSGFETARSAATELMKRLGATDYTQEATEGTPTAFKGKDGYIYNYNGAGHFCGTHIMGDDPQTSVVDSFQRSHDHKNLYIVGCGSMPSVGTQNPTLTLVALVSRTAQDILHPRPI